MRILSIRTSFKHHGENAGYKQILKYLKPSYVVGIDESKGESSKLKRKYQWLFEFRAWRKYRRNIDIVHVMYGEDYYRFSAYIFKKPVIVSYHQPPELLAREVRFGDFRGRIGRITHKMTKKRFAKAAAVIVMEQGQKEVFKEVMPEEKIHVIPLGVHNKDLSEFYHDKKNQIVRNRNQVLTVGNWLRDWKFYFDLLRKCEGLYPELEFVLVNRNMPKEWMGEISKRANLSYLTDVNDDELFSLYMKSAVQFLPVKSAAGNNALLQGLVLGCPVLMTNVISDEFPFKGKFASFYEKDNFENCIQGINEFSNLNEKENLIVEESAIAVAKKYDWEQIAKRTKEIYKSVL